MLAKEAIKSAARRTIDEPPSTIGGYPATFLDNLATIGPEIGQPKNPNIAEDLAFVLCNPTAPTEQRKESASRALNTIKTTMFDTTQHIGRAVEDIDTERIMEQSRVWATNYLTDDRQEAVVSIISKAKKALHAAEGVDFSSVIVRAQGVSQRFVEGALAAAEQYPAPPKVKDLGSEMIQLLKPQKENQIEDNAVAAYVLFDLFQPYLVDKLLEIHIYDPDELRQQSNALARDAALLKRFYHAFSPSLQFAADKKTDMPIEEMAERLFEMGPLIIKMIQGLNIPEDKAKTPQSVLAVNLARVLQEGAAKPTEAEVEQIRKELPPGLTDKGHISSASVAHIRRTETSKGEERATKVLRPGIKQAIDDDAATYELIGNILIRFAEEHIEDTSSFAPFLARVKKALPFGLAIENDQLKAEIDLARERRAQKKATVIFKRHSGVRIPKIDPRYTDETHLTMEIINGTPIEDLPANPDYIKNIMVLLVQSWKERFMYGDMHDRNIKGTEDGSIIAYDWGKYIDIPQGFVKDMGKFIFSIMKKNPDAIAKAYRKIQHPEYKQATEEEIAASAREALSALDVVREARESKPRKNGKPRSKMTRPLRDVGLLIPAVVGTIGLREQSTVDTNYGNFLQTAVRISNVLGKELEKPEYQDKNRAKILLTGLRQAVKEVYFTRSKSVASDETDSKQE